MHFQRQNALEKRIIFPIPLQKILLGEEWTYMWILNGFEMDIHWMYHLGWEMDVDLDKILVWKQ